MANIHVSNKDKNLLPEIESKTLEQLQEIFKVYTDGLVGNFIAIVIKAIPRYHGKSRLTLPENMRKDLARNGAEAGALVIGVGDLAGKEVPKCKVGKVIYINNNNGMPSFKIDDEETGYSMFVYNVHQVILFTDKVWGDSVLRLDSEMNISDN